MIATLESPTKKPVQTGFFKPNQNPTWNNLFHHDR